MCQKREEPLRGFNMRLSLLTAAASALALRSLAVGLKERRFAKAKREMGTTEVEDQLEKL